MLQKQIERERQIKGDGGSDGEEERDKDKVREGSRKGERE
jgi:hypothetical protein